MQPSDPEQDFAEWAHRCVVGFGTFFGVGWLALLVWIFFT